MALEAVCVLISVSHLAALHKVYPMQTAHWKKQLLDRAADVFDPSSLGQSGEK